LKHFATLEYVHGVLTIGLDLATGFGRGYNLQCRSQIKEFVEMAKPPLPTQRRYRGRIRSLMRSAQKHLTYLQNWNNFYLGKPIDYYPNQLAPSADMVTVSVMLAQLGYWLEAGGPIPSRPSS
jgi:hypothetical protein